MKFLPAAISLFSSISRPAMFACDKVIHDRSLNRLSELSIPSGLYCNRLFFRSALLKRGVNASKTVYSLGFAQNWKISCFTTGLRTTEL